MSRPLPRVQSQIRGRLGGDPEQVLARAERELRRMGQLTGLDGEHELSLVLCDNPTIRKINATWRGMDQPTDVLSFPLHELKPGRRPPPGAVGDIVISLVYLRKAAKELGVTETEHLRRLLAHGLLHLLGYDHATDRQHRVMLKHEENLLAGKALQ